MSFSEIQEGPRRPVNKSSSVTVLVFFLDLSFQIMLLFLINDFLLFVAFNVFRTALFSFNMPYNLCQHFGYMVSTIFRENGELFSAFNGLSSGRAISTYNFSWINIVWAFNPNWYPKCCQSGHHQYIVSKRKTYIPFSQSRPGFHFNLCQQLVVNYCDAQLSKIGWQNRWNQSIVNLLFLGFILKKQSMSIYCFFRNGTIYWWCPWGWHKLKKQ